jgi:hypothetical protein
MTLDPDDADTVIRPRDESVRVDIGIDIDVELDDADTVIRERAPFADVPLEALQALRAPATVPTAPLSPQLDLDTTLPTDYRFTINSNPPIGLDATAIIGRRPTLPRVMKGRAPRLVRVPSPLREVSSTHVELRQQGALVVVTDLRSTNGSIVTVPGREPVKLRQGESVVVVPGTTIDIGDGNLVEILPLQSNPS